MNPRILLLAIGLFLGLAGTAKAQYSSGGIITNTSSTQSLAVGAWVGIAYYDSDHNVAYTSGYAVSGVAPSGNFDTFDQAASWAMNADSYFADAVAYWGGTREATESYNANINWYYYY